MEARVKIICCVTNELALDRRMHRICEALDCAGYEVELIGRKKRNGIPIIEKPYKQTELTCLFPKGKMFYFEFNLRLMLMLLAKSSTAIYAVDLDTLLACTVIAKLKRLKIIFDAHEWFTELPEVERRPMVRKFWTWVENWGTARADLRFTVGTSLAKTLSDQHNKTFHVVRNVPARDGKPAKSTTLNRRAMVYLGALNEGRGLEVAIDALLELPNYDLWLVGEGDLSTELRKLVASYNLDKQVKFFGMTTADKWKKILPDAFVGLNLLESRSKSYYHSLANKFFDYIHVGIPGIHMRFPEYEMLNEQIETSLLLNTLSKNELLTAIRTLENDRELYSALKVNCRRAAELWNWEREREKLLGPIHALLHHSRV